VSGEEHMQIGEVAECTGLSLRTIRYYEETGLIPPSARSSGGFRLYTGQDVERLEMVKRMKLIDLSIDEMRELLRTLDGLEDDGTDPGQLEGLHARLELYQQLARQRVCTLRGQLTSAERFSRDLDQRGSRRTAAAKRPR
jgi:DNA-binding transcriptional MerR regulator